jgi:hypothetical protein
MAHHHLATVSEAVAQQQLPNATCPTPHPCLLDDTRKTAFLSATDKHKSKAGQKQNSTGAKQHKTGRYMLRSGVPMDLAASTPMPSVTMPDSQRTYLAPVSPRTPSHSATTGPMCTKSSMAELSRYLIAGSLASHCTSEGPHY